MLEHALNLASPTITPSLSSGQRTRTLAYTADVTALYHRGDRIVGAKRQEVR